MTLTVFCQLDRSTREVELGLEYGPPAMTLGGQTWKFEDGQWISGRDLKNVKQHLSKYVCKRLYRL